VRTQNGDVIIDLGTLDAQDEEYEAAHASCKEVFTGSGIDLPYPERHPPITAHMGG
jgi:hypothetical protein